MNCPRCRGNEMESGKAKGADITLDRCPTCRGIWFDRKELGSVIKLADRELQIPPGARVSRRDCPRCRKALRSFYYPGTLVGIDTCPKCRGIWLDRGELNEMKAVLEYNQREGQDSSEASTPPEPANPGGIKGALLNFINNTLSSFDWS